MQVKYATEAEKYRHTIAIYFTYRVSYVYRVYLRNVVNLYDL